MNEETNPLEPEQITPANKHCGITQVANGYILYMGTDTMIANDLNELFGHLRGIFTN